eukprot:CAMPEP_0172528330 /NCGR_PEP_ID=MMETSP1067-20121228/2765_1 /TAXON_ID=265564 ORGANISM="Thalassiosira punctigera, Strain Tpunct2005C2" /NCGR_SAMPLE_ID=MMETSP1067 /ASSEMBLY_ACC=CAM_ASM_000444 /LENGTH=43 /DNA_ID= /DNA_START= /DNA_END= /DNA_ORIENTATION=
MPVGAPSASFTTSLDRASINACILKDKVYTAINWRLQRGVDLD